MTAFDTLITQARLPETTVPVCLRGDLVAEFQALERQLQTASTVAPSLGERAPARVIAEQMQALREEMTAAEIPVRLRALPALEWANFAATRPAPRKDDESKDAWLARWFAWMAELVSRCAIDPVMTVEQVGQLVDHLSGVQWDDLSNAAWSLNEQRVKIPFSDAASGLTQAPEPT